MSDRPRTPPVQDWATDYDIFDPDYIEDPAPVWAELRERCPIARTERWGGSWLPTRYEDMQAFVRMVPALSSSDPLVVSAPDEIRRQVEADGFNNPPITADPPEQVAYRRLILPLFTPQAVARHGPFTEALCHELIDGFIADGQCDAAVDYAQQIPPRVIAHLIGVDARRSEEFIDWVRGSLEIGLVDPEVRIRYRAIIRDFFLDLVARRRAQPGDDFVSHLLRQRIDGEPVTDVAAAGVTNLLLVAGIDTTWSSIGSALWHFASKPGDRERLANEPDLFPTAIEELLRFYSPVTMARRVRERVEVRDVVFERGDKVLMNFPGANRDPEVFERADEVVLDRQRNRHIAFGVGIHRCAGSNLARMEMDVALRTWFERVPDFELTDPAAVTWAGGQVRGPRRVPVRFARGNVRG